MPLVTDFIGISRSQKKNKLLPDEHRGADPGGAHDQDCTALTFLAAAVILDKTAEKNCQIRDLLRWHAETIFVLHGFHGQVRQVIQVPILLDNDSAELVIHVD